MALATEYSNWSSVRWLDRLQRVVSQAGLLVPDNSSTYFAMNTQAAGV